MKSYTNIEQSKKLAEILPIESADMFYHLGESQLPNVIYGNHDDFKGYLPCWSLTALLNTLPQIKIRGSKKIGYIVYYNKDITSSRCFDIVDACYELILKLNELNLL